MSYAVQKVLQLYNHLPISQRPRKVTILAHSMGGIVARLAGMKHADLFDVVITMSTPHLYPPVNLEIGMSVLYDKINSVPANGSTPLLFSVCGGVSDSQIISDACALPNSLISPDDGFAVFATGVPGAWTGVDHQAMVWCHQIRWRVARVLLEISRSDAREEKLRVARRWLLGRMSGDMAQTIDGGDEKRFPVTSSQMSLLVRGSSDDPAATEPQISVKLCSAGGSCNLIATSMESFPSPKMEDAPFPLSGEGVKPSETAYVLDLLITEGSTELLVTARQDLKVELGERIEETVIGHEWSEFIRGQLDTR